VSAYLIYLIPSAPFLLLPQAITSQSLVKAIQCTIPLESSVIFYWPSSSTNLGVWIISSLPSLFVLTPSYYPFALFPQTIRPPDLFTKYVCETPQTIYTIVYVAIERTF